MFEFDGQRFTLASMLEANADDDDLCEWLRSAKPDQHYPSISGGVLCVA